jgi:hypothetical protein
MCLIHPSLWALHMSLVRFTFKGEGQQTPAKPICAAACRVVVWHIEQGTSVHAVGIVMHTWKVRRPTNQPTSCPCEGTVQYSTGHNTDGVCM